MELVQDHCHEDQDAVCGEMSAGALRGPAPKGHVVLTQVGVLDEALGDKALDLVAENGLVEVHLSVRHHDAVAFAEQLVADDRVLGDEADRRGEGRDAHGFLPGALEAWALLCEVVLVDLGAVERGCYLALDHGQERRVEEEVRDEPEASLAEVGRGAENSQSICNKSPKRTRLKLHLPPINRHGHDCKIAIIQTRVPHLHLKLLGPPHNIAPLFLGRRKILL
jgi:hypothetical protein